MVSAWFQLGSIMQKSYYITSWLGSGLVPAWFRMVPDGSTIQKILSFATFWLDSSLFPDGLVALGSGWFHNAKLRLFATFWLRSGLVPAWFRMVPYCKNNMICPILAWFLLGSGLVPDGAITQTKILFTIFWHGSCLVLAWFQLS